MSLLMWAHESDHFVIMTDTLAPTDDLTRVEARTKLWPVPHMNLAVGCTGWRMLGRRWALYVGELGLSGIEELHQVAPAVLPLMLAQLEQEYGPPAGTASTSTVYHFGIDAEGRAVRYTYRSERGFAGETHTDRELCEKPQPTDGRFIPFTTLDEMIAAARELQRQQDKLPPKQRVHVGGELFLTELRDGSVITERVYRFES